MHLTGKQSSVSESNSSYEPFHLCVLGCGVFVRKHDFPHRFGAPFGGGSKLCARRQHGRFCSVSSFMPILQRECANFRFGLRSRYLECLPFSDVPQRFLHAYADYRPPAVLILGVFGSAVFYKSLCLLEDNTHIARLTGISYMLGTMLQIANSNLVHIDIAEAAILSVFIMLLALMLIRAEKNSVVPALSKSEPDGGNGRESLKISVILVFFVALMTCIFSTLDNAVTLIHASGEANIGQWPRVLLALSGLLAGFLFDTASRKYMSIVMYCITVLSTTCLVILQFAGSFTVGLVIFYLAAGFFAVFFTVSFMEIARYTETPELWAGLGRAVNNLVAVLISGGSLALLNSGNNIAIITIELLLFVLASVAAFAYMNKRKAFFDGLEAEAADKLSDGERLQKLAEQFSLTPREAEVFGLLVNTEDGLQTIADNLYVSRRTLERYVSAIYEKTGARSRIGLVTLYNNA